MSDDHSWDLDESEEGNTPDGDDAFHRKYEEWQERDWMAWLSEHLTFPFAATRAEDDDVYAQKGAANAPFQVGHTMEILSLGEEDVDRGIMVEAQEKGRVGEVPLCDLQVKPKTDNNYWPVREYVVWTENS